MAGKKFKFRIDAHNRVGIKEQRTQTMNTRGKRVSISIGLNSEFDISDKYIIKDNILIPILDENSITRGRGGYAIYYSMSDISYIATVTVQYNKKGKIIEKMLTLYIPKGLYSVDEIYCNRITGDVTHEQYTRITEKVFNSVIDKCE